MQRTIWINVQPGDYFEVAPYQDSGGTLNMLGSVGTFFTIETR